MSRYIPVEPENWAEMVIAMAEVHSLKAEVERLRVAGEDLAHAVRTKHGVDFALEEWDKEANKGGQP